MKFPREQIESEWVISVKYLKDLKSKIENQIPIKYISDLDLEDIEAVLLALEISKTDSTMKASMNGARRNLVRDFNEFVRTRDDDSLNEIRNDIVALCCMYSDQLEDFKCIINDVSISEIGGDYE
jgi:hypothetical protein